MRKSHILSRLMVMAFMLCVAAVALAQNGDKLFIDGQKLQQTMTVASQNAAIQKFKAAKVAYTTADKKKMCDNQIAICNKNISQIKRGGGGGSGKKGASQTASTATTSTRFFSVSHSNIVFDGDKAGSLNVRVDAPTKNWKFSVPAGVGGMDNFLKVTRSNDAKSIDIAVEANDQTLDREQVIQIDYGDNQKEIKVRQLGKSVTLSTDHHQVEFGLKGGKKSIEVYTNSDSIISTNYDQTWYVESKPDWVEVKVEVKKEKGIFGQLGSALKKAVTGTAAASTGQDTKTSKVTLITKSIDKKSPEFSTGRKGEIVFSSEDKKFRMTVIQQK